MAIAAPINTVLDHTTDAGFRAWVAEYLSLLTTGGALVQTADTGQINPTTVSRPGSNTSAGYAIFRFDDSLQATAPYFFRFDFGTSGSPTWHRVQLTVGTGTNGAGSITGVIRTAFDVSAGSAASIATVHPSYACGHAGLLCLGWKIGALVGSTGLSVLGILRTRAWDGSQTAEGIVLYWKGASNELQQWAHRRVSPTEFGPSGNVCLVPHGVTNSIQPGGSPQMYRHFTALPETRPILEFLTVAAAEMSAGAVDTARPVGLTDRTFLCLGRVVAPAAAGATSTSHHLCMLYD